MFVYLFVLLSVCVFFLIQLKNVADIFIVGGLVRSACLYILTQVEVNGGAGR